MRKSQKWKACWRAVWGTLGETGGDGLRWRLADSPGGGPIFNCCAFYFMKPTRLLLLAVLPSMVATVSAQNTHSMTAQSMLMNALSAVYPNLNPPEAPQTKYYDGVDLYTNEGDTFKVDQSLTFSSSTLKSVYTRLSMTSDVVGRVGASWQATDEFTIPVNDYRQLIVRDFTLTRVDLQLGNVQLGLQPQNGETSHLTLHDATLQAGSYQPLFYAPSPLTFAVTGSSQIVDWQGRMGSQTTLTASGGATLRIKNSGDLGSTVLNDKLYFDKYANQAIFENGASLLLDHSALVWGSDSVVDDAKDSRMVFRNGSTLQIGGFVSYGAKLDTDILSIQDSTLTLGNGGSLNLRHRLELTNATVNIGSGALAEVDHGTNSVEAHGASTVTINSPGGTGIKTAFLDVSDTAGAVLTLKGEGVTTVTRGLLFPFSGTAQGAVRVEEDAMLELTSSSDTYLDSRSILSTDSVGSIELRADATMKIVTGALVTNAGVFTVRENAVLTASGSAVIGGRGELDVDASLVFDREIGQGSRNTLTTTNDVVFGSQGSLSMRLDAVALRNDHLVINREDSRGSIALNSSGLTVLDLALWRDAALAPGTRFDLIEYPIGQDGMGYFKGLIDGAEFALGLNSYTINYNDPAAQTAGSKFVTLTVVPEPSAVLLGLGALGALGWRRRRAESV